MLSFKPSPSKVDAADVNVRGSASLIFLNISKEFKKRQSSLILSVVAEGGGGHAGRGRLFWKLGCLKYTNRKQTKNVIQRSEN